jgi:predicted RNA binding protein YcfA (HicA-like mRNA interferase family)
MDTKSYIPRGSHTHLRMGEIKVTIPTHGNKELKIGTMNNILKIVGLSFEKIKEFI